jgi:hypothetical protein
VRCQLDHQENRPWISASDIETTNVCVQNLHMHTFLVADRFLKISAGRSNRIFCPNPLGTGFAL